MMQSRPLTLPTSLCDPPAPLFPFALESRIFAPCFTITARLQRKERERERERERGMDEREKQRDEKIESKKNKKISSSFPCFPFCLFFYFFLSLFLTLSRSLHPFDVPCVPIPIFHQSLSELPGKESPSRIRRDYHWVVKLFFCEISGSHALGSEVTYGGGVVEVAERQRETKRETRGEIGGIDGWGISERSKGYIDR